MLSCPAIPVPVSLAALCQLSAGRDFRLVCFVVLGFSVSFVRLFPPLLFVAHLDPYDLDEPHLGASIQIFDPFLLRSLSV